MSEMKEHLFCECDECIREYRGPLSNEMRPYYLKSEADKVIADLEKSHKKEVEQLLMKIAGLEKLVEIADKLVKQKGGFTIKDVTFNGVKLEGMPSEQEV